jgi:uncharacterized protein YkwD
MKSKSVAGGIVLALANVLLSAAPGQAQQIQIDASQIVAAIMTETNRYRAAHGASQLQSHPALARAAQQYAEFQARTNTSGHSADGRTVQQRILATNAYKPCAWAENVFEYWSQPNVAAPVIAANAAMEFWKKSPGHEANLRNPRMKQIGIGAAAWKHAGRNYYKVVQVFGDDCATAPPPGTATPGTGTSPPPSGGGTASGPATVLGERIAAYALARLGHCINAQGQECRSAPPEGECTHLAEAALAYAKAKPARFSAKEYVWGNPVSTPERGDIIQFWDARFTSPDGRSWWGGGAGTHHTAIVLARKGSVVTLIEQNVNNVRKVMQKDYDLSWPHSGRLVVYRAVPL